MDLRDLAGLAGEIYARSLLGRPDEDQDEAFEDRSVKLETTFGGAGMLTGDLTPECAAVVTTVLMRCQRRRGRRTPGRRRGGSMMGCRRRYVNCEMHRDLRGACTVAAHRAATSVTGSDGAAGL